MAQTTRLASFGPFLIVVAVVWCGTGGGTSLGAGLVVLGGEGARDASSRAPFVVVVETLPFPGPVGWYD